MRLTSTDLPTHAPASFAFDRTRPQDAAVNLLPPAINTVRFDGSYLVLPATAAEAGEGPGTPADDAGSGGGGSDARDSDSDGESDTGSGSGSHTGRASGSGGGGLPFTGFAVAVAALAGAALLLGGLALRRYRFGGSERA